jgi:hypothetical protein
VRSPPPTAAMTKQVLFIYDLLPGGEEIRMLTPYEEKSRNSGGRKKKEIKENGKFKGKVKALGGD